MSFENLKGIFDIFYKRFKKHRRSRSLQRQYYIKLLYESVFCCCYSDGYHLASILKNQTKRIVLNSGTITANDAEMQKWWETHLFPKILKDVAVGCDPPVLYLTVLHLSLPIAFLNFPLWSCPALWHAHWRLRGSQSPEGQEDPGPDSCF